MKKISVLIADDEPLAREKLRMLLARDAEIGVVQEAGNVRKTLQAVNAMRPAVLFLDIQMPDGDGFEVLQEIGMSVMPLVVFTTAYDRYAIRAFEAHAVDYLLKPFDEERFRKSLERVKTNLRAADRAASAGRVLELLGSMSAAPIQGQKFAVKSQGRIVFVNPGEIDWLEAASNYVRLHTGSSWYLIRSTIGETESKLDRQCFLRIHRSVIVNVDRIKEIRPCNSGEFIVTLRNGKELPASRTYRQNLVPLFIRTL
jgi:two-component system, LytTR family, response regulator